MPFPTPTFPSEFGRTPDLQVSKKEFAALYSQFQKFLAVAHDSDGHITSVDRIDDYTGWTVVPYDATVFVASGAGTWTVPPASILRFAYRMIGDSMSIHLTINGTANITVGAASELLVTLPNHRVATETCGGSGQYADDVTPGFQTLVVYSAANVNYITMKLQTGTIPVTANQILIVQLECQTRQA